MRTVRFSVSGEKSSLFGVGEPGHKTPRRLNSTERFEQPRERVAVQRGSVDSGEGQIYGRSDGACFRQRVGHVY